MEKGRIEAFSDGVLAIIVTIIILEFKAPKSGEWKELIHLYPKFFSYVLSFFMVWIYWNNHHNIFQRVEKINSSVLLANGILLFMISFQPFATAWMGETNFATNPVMLMGFILLLSGGAYVILVNCLIKANGGKESTLAKVIGKDRRESISIVIYIIAIIIAFWLPAISFGIYCLVALMWLIPDKRIKEILRKRSLKRLFSWSK